MKSGREQLAAWLGRCRMNQTTFARLIDIKDSEMSKLINGRRGPTMAIAARIEDHTGIPIRSWVPKKRGNPGKFRRQKGLQPQVSNEESCAVRS